MTQLLSNSVAFTYSAANDGPVNLVPPLFAVTAKCSETTLEEQLQPNIEPPLHEKFSYPLETLFKSIEFQKGLVRAVDKAGWHSTFTGLTKEPRLSSLKEIKKTKFDSVFL